MLVVLISLLSMVETPVWCAEPLRARKAMVVSGEAHATDIGLAVLKAGGNAMDAATAMAFALSVTHSGMTGLGGGGIVLIRTKDGRSAFFDFRELAPGKARRNMFLDKGGNLSPDSVTGWRAAATPTYVMGWGTVHERYGARPWAELLMPAVELAKSGYPVGYKSAQAFRTIASLGKDPESKRIFQNGGKFFEPGDTLVQPELGATLERIAKNGADEFYEGETAKRLVEAMAANGGLITMEDLAAASVAEPPPLIGKYRGHQILTASGSSSGGIGLLQMLAVLERTGFEQHGAGSATAIHYQAEAMRRFFADRSEHMGDPDFVQVPVRAMLSPAHIEELRASIDPDHATPSGKVKPGKFPESNETTHFAVVDAEGNAVSATVTLNGQYGSGVTVPGLGFLLNNNMDNFAANPGKTNQYGLVQGEANAIQPGKRPVSSMTPAIVLEGGSLKMVVGTPGGPTILNSVLQAVINVIDFGRNAQDAVAAPRIHHQWYPDTLFVEPGFSPDTLALLKARGHNIEVRLSNNDLNMILVQDGWLQGGIDPRREGKAAGY
ncbi:MAG: gamma-glutamyltransferase [Acidobacteria bacterium]|nr:gamma-glutamyltransferase [Acidobacteriota bacterium]